MATEHFPAERQGLSLFLAELLPAVAAILGEGTLLHHAVRRALRTGDLGQLRHARQLLTNLPAEQRQALVRAVARADGPAAPWHERRETHGRRPPASFVSFELATGEEDEATVSLTHELLARSALRVLVSPGTLPHAAADGLRRIARTIEGDRRLLSDRHWQDHGPADGADLLPERFPR